MRRSVSRLCSLPLLFWVSRLSKFFVQASKTDVVFVSYETLEPPADVTVFIKARRKDPAAVQKEVEKCVSSSKRMLAHKMIP